MAKEKGVIVSFRVDRHLADVLNKAPDKSAFIRDIILRSFYESCPVCRGRGVVPEELARWSEAQMRAAGTQECHCCRYSYPKSQTGGAKSKRKTDERFVCPHCQSHGHGH